MKASFRVAAFAVVFFPLILTACSDGDPSPDGRPRAAGSQKLEQAITDYEKSAPVRRVSQYAQAVGRGLVNPMLEDANRRALLAKASRRHMNEPRPLSDDERCIGNSIVRIDRRSKPESYVQVLQGGRPIYCRGGF